VFLGVVLFTNKKGVRQMEKEEKCRGCESGCCTEKAEDDFCTHFGRKISADDPKCGAFGIKKIPGQWNPHFPSDPA
jgi:hypothetical protein